MQAARALRIEAAVKALASNPKLRSRILEARTSYEQTIDTVSTDTVIEAGFSTDATTRAKKTITDWEAFIGENKDELAALQILYSKPAGKRLTFAEIRELANAIQRPPRAWTTEQLWDAYETVERSRVRGHGGRVLTDLVSLVRFTIEYAPELVPWTETVNERFAGWLGAQAQQGVVFGPAQRQWLELIRDQIAGSLSITSDDLMEPPFSQHGGLARARAIFGDQLERLGASRAWIAGESSALRDIYDGCIGDLNRAVSPACREAWQSPPVTSAAGMNLSGFGGGGASDVVCRMERAVAYRFGWRRALPPAIVGVRLRHHGCLPSPETVKEVKTNDQLEEARTRGAA